jgi:neutral ceramidase
MRKWIAVGLLAVAVACLGVPARTLANRPLRVAYAEADITPPLGGSMPGYFQDRKATGVLDPLKAKVLYLRKGDAGVVLIACDLIGMERSIAARIRTEVGRRVRSRPEHVWVHCTHTHTGGMLSRHFTSDADRIYPGLYPGVVDERWISEVVQRVTEAAQRAAKQLVDEPRPTLHEGQAAVAQYRRYYLKDGTVRTNPGRNNPEVVGPVGEIDPRVHVLRFPQSRTLAVIYGLHPDCVGGTRYSADYPHHLTEALRAELGREWNVLFLNAACGNINHIDVNDPNQKSGPEESKRIGMVLAAAVREALRREQPLAVDTLATTSATVASRLRRPKPEELAEAQRRLQANDRAFEFNGLFAPAVLVLGRTKDREHPAEVNALRIGSFGLAAMPGEIFVELAREVEVGSPFRPTRTIGLTNGAMGYFPHPKGYVEGGYEAGYRSAHYEPDTGQRWAETAARLMRRLRKSD